MKPEALQSTGSNYRYFFSPRFGGSAIKKPTPKKKAPAKKPPAGKAKGGGKDIVVFGLNVSGLANRLASLTKKRPGPAARKEPSNVLEDDLDYPVEVVVEMMEPDDGQPAPARQEESKPARRAVEDDFDADNPGDGELDGEEEEEAPKKRGPFGLFSLFGGKKKARPAKGGDKGKGKEKPGKRKPINAFREDGDEEEDFGERDEFADNDNDDADKDEFDEEEEEDVSPRGRKGKKDKGGKKGKKGARGGRKKKGASPVVVLLLVIVLLAGLAYAAHMNGFIDLSMYLDAINIDQIVASLAALPSLIGL